MVSGAGRTRGAAGRSLSRISGTGSLTANIARLGQPSTQASQPFNKLRTRSVHFSWSTSLCLQAVPPTRLMAPTGQASAQIPQPVHFSMST